MLPCSTAAGAQYPPPQLMHDVLEATSKNFILFDAEMRFLLCDKQYLKLFQSKNLKPPKVGDTAQQIVEQVFANEVFKKGFDTSVSNSTREFLEFISSHGNSYEVQRCDGRKLIFSSHRTQLGNHIITCPDQTELNVGSDKNSQTSLAVVNDAIQALDEILVMFDSDLKFVMANDLYYRAFFTEEPQPEIGEPAADILARVFNVGFFNLPDIVTKEMFVQGAITDMRSYLKNSIFETTDNRIMTASIHKTALDGYLISFKDITEQRTANERALAAVTDAIQALDEALVLFDADLCFVMANRRWYELFIKKTCPPAVGEKASELMRRLLDEDFFDLSNYLTEFDFARDIIRNVRNYVKNIHIVTRNGSILEGSAHKTKLGGYLLSFSDVTEMLTMQEELEHQRVAAIQNEKLSALGELLAGVAHELNNPLSIIVGYTQMLEGNIVDPVLEKRVDRISQAANRSAKIVKTFLAMARQQPAKVEHCSINEIVTTALDIAGYGLRSIGTKIELEFDESLPLISGDVDQLAQVFTNLIINAEHALAKFGGDGSLTLKTSFDKKADRVVVEIHDNGEGIADAIQARIFEPFFTTKDVGKGTGVGLAFCHRIVSSHGGSLTVKSIQGQGCSFFVELRRAQGDVIESMDENPKTYVVESKHILVVDDEVHIAELLADLLAVAGHTVCITNNAIEALELLKVEEFSAILCDFKMPDIDGAEFSRQLLACAPEYASRIGFITGDTMSNNVIEFLNRTEHPYIEKPFASDELDELVEKLCRPPSK